MRFGRVVFLGAGVWGILLLTPLFFAFDLIGQRFPPPITHADFYYGFLTVALAWQFAFLVIGRDPIRFRPMMLPAMLEKFGYVGRSSRSMCSNGSRPARRWPRHQTSSLECCSCSRYFKTPSPIVRAT